MADPTVSGIIVVAADASDDVGVVGVQFYLDGVALGAEVLTPPYEILWDSSSVVDGTYTLTALARDAAGNMTTSLDVVVVVLNAVVLPAGSGFYLLQAPAFTAWTDEGDPGAGYKLYAYEDGTDIPAPTYQDRGGVALQTWPVVMNEAGRAIVFIPDASVRLYTFVLKTDADVLVYSVQGVSIPAIVAPAPQAAVPVGTLLPYAGATVPMGGFLFCDGASVSRDTYRALFGVLGTTFGRGNGTSTFTLPDFRQRFPLGVAASGTGSVLGATGGDALVHSHTGPSHTHGVLSHTHGIPHTHGVPRDGWPAGAEAVTVTGRVNIGSSAGVGALSSAYQATASPNTGAVSAPGTTDPTTLTTDAGGSDLTGTASVPFLALNWVVKT